MNNMLQDLRFAVRTLFRAPAFTTASVLTLALGIGATTALFSVVNGVLLRTLPYPNPDRIVQVWQLNDSGSRTNVSDLDFEDIAAQSRSFKALAQFNDFMASVSGGSESARVGGALVSRDAFEVLGVRPIMGRTFLPEEQQQGGVPAVLVSHGYWQRNLGGSGDALGRVLMIDYEPFTVVGVMPPGFDFPSRTEFWIPRELFPRFSNRKALNWKVVGRLGDGVTLAQARQDVSAIARRLKAEHGEDTWMEGLELVPLHDQLVGQVRLALLVLLGASAFLLLIGSANVVNLSLAQLASRRRELAVRLALGASRWQIARQFLAESIVLALVGGGLGVILATWGVELLVAFEPGTLPRVDEIRVDLPVLGFALAVSALTAGTLALVAAIRATGDEVRGTLAEGQRTSSEGRSGQRVRGGLVACQVALTLVLLVGAGLLARSFVGLLAVDPGFRTRSLVTMDLVVPGAQGDPVGLARFHEELSARLRAIPGVKEVGGVNALPLTGSGVGGTFLIVEHQDDVQNFEDWERISRDETRTGYAEFRVADAGYFAALGIPLIQGRLFDDRDGPDAPHVAVISESLAKRRWPGEDPIGKRIQYANMDSDFRVFTIVGIVGDVRDEGLDAEPSPTFYGNARQRVGATSRYTYVLHGVGDPATIIASARRAVHELDPEVPPGFRTIEQVISSTLADRTFSLFLLGVFGAAALLLAVTGVYGVIAFLVAQQTREIGIRVALGAQRENVIRMVVGRGVRLTTIGLAAGLLAAFWLTKLLAGLLYGIEATDPVTFAAIAFFLLGVTAVASWIPARRAARVDPMIAIRAE